MTPPSERSGEGGEVQDHDPLTRVRANLLSLPTLPNPTPGEGGEAPPLDRHTRERTKLQTLPTLPSPQSHPPQGDPEPVSQQLILTVPEAAQTLRIGRSSVYELIATGQLRSLKIGSRRLIAREDLEAFVNTQRELAE